MVSRGVAVLVLALVFARAAAACSCITLDPKSAFKQSTDVFFGEVVSWDRGVTTFRVMERFKGARSDTIAIETSNGTCSYGAVDAGVRHLIYAIAHRGRPVTSLCSRSKPETHAACDLTYLRSRAAWWRSPLSSLRILRGLGRRGEPCATR